MGIDAQVLFFYILITSNEAFQTQFFTFLFLLMNSMVAEEKHGIQGSAPSSQNDKRPCTAIMCCKATTIIVKDTMRIVCGMGGQQMG